MDTNQKAIRVCCFETGGTTWKFAICEKYADQNGNIIPG